MDPSDIIVITIAPVGAPGAGVTAGEKATILAGLATLSAQKLEEHTGVDATGIAAGKVLLRNPGNTGWIIGTVPGLTRMEQDGVSQITSVGAINAKNGLLVTDDGSGEAGLAPSYGSTANTIAPGDHTHNPVINNAPTFAATGVLSSGSRTLITHNVTLLAGVTYDIKAHLIVPARNNINNGTFLEKVQIAGGTVLSIQKGTVGGVPIEYNAVQVGSVVGTGAAISIIGSVTFDSGDPTDFRAGQLVVTASPRR